MSVLAQRLQRIWYPVDATIAPPLWLRTLVPIYRGLRIIDQWRYRSGWRKPVALSIPVIVVGNITVGGTGKTPLTVALVHGLRARGFRPGVVSRGYAGSARTPQVLDDNADSAIVGDEPCLIQRQTGVPVAIGRDRPQAARLLLEQGVDVIVADDGLQNPSLARDVEICVIDGCRRFGNGHLLPAGPLREPKVRLARVDFRVCNRGDLAADIDVEVVVGEVPMHLVGDTAVALADRTHTRSLDDLAGQRVHGVAGIGNPERFFASLRAHAIKVVAHPFADHHAYRASDLAFNDRLPIVMTEKDAVKCVRFGVADSWYVTVRAEVPASFLDQVCMRLGTFGTTR